MYISADKFDIISTPEGKDVFRRGLWRRNGSLMENSEILKGTGHYLYFPKITVNIKTYFGAGNGGKLILKNIVRNGSLWSNAVLGKEVISHSNIKRSLLLGVWKHTNPCNNGVCSFIIFMKINWPNMLKFVILCICWDTPRENTGPVQLHRAAQAEHIAKHFCLLKYTGHYW